MKKASSIKRGSSFGSPGMLLGAGSLLALLLVFIESPVALAIVLTDGVLAAGILAAASVPGIAVLRLIVRRADRSSLIFGAGLGIGFLCLAQLGMGLAGWLTRGAVVGVLAVGLVFGGLLLLPAAVRKWLDEGEKDRRPLGWHGCAALAIVPFAALTLIVATAPPGTLWAEEANGYDVLEYHLAAPKAYYEAGQIHFLPGNAYASFPQNAEMLYLLAMVIRGDAVEAAMLAQMLNALLALLTVAAAWSAARPYGPRAALLAAILAGTCGWLVYLSGVAYVENAMLLWGTLAVGAWVRARHEGTEARRHEGDQSPKRQRGESEPEARARDIRARSASDGWDGGEPVKRRGATAEPPPLDPPLVRGEGVGPAPSWRWILMCGLFAGLACGCKYTAIPLIALPLGLAIVFRAIADCFAFPPIACAPGSDGEAVSYQLSAVSRTSRTPTLLSLLATRYSKLFAFPPVACAPGSDSLRACILFGFGAILTFGPWLARNVAFCGNPVFPLATKTVGWRGEIWSDESAARWDAGHRPPAHARSLGGRVQAVWGGVIAHPRTGPALWLLGAAAVVLAPRAAWPWAVMLIVQLAGWAGLTHLVDRMAVPVLPVLFVLGARLAEDRRTAVRSAAFGVALLGAALNLYRVQGLYYDHARVVEENGRTARLGLHGQTAWFVEGQWPGTAHLGFINRELSADARILMVADARPFYVRRWCEACVVFNPNPLAAAVRDSRDAAAVLEWLRSTGYTHVYVDRVEMRRLRATYGFWPEIDEALFDRLERAGLKRIQDFTFGPGGPTYGTIYEVGK